MACGISTKASLISTKVAPKPRGLARISASCCGVSGSSRTVITEYRMVTKDSTPPMMKAMRVISGMPLASTASRFMPIHTKMLGAR